MLFPLIKYFLVIFLLSCDRNKSKNKINIGFSQAMSNDDWRRSMNNSMKLQASMNPEINLIFRDANYDVLTQIKHINGLIADSVDVLIVSPIKSKPISAAVNKAFKAGIPVLLIVLSLAIYNIYSILAIRKRNRQLGDKQ